MPKAKPSGPPPTADTPGEHLSRTGRMLGTPDELLLRETLQHYVTGLVEARGLTQAGIAKLLKLHLPDVSALVNRKSLLRFSTKRLIRFLTLLDHDVEIVVRPKKTGQPRGQVSIVVQ